ncbi:PhzF family phenazine biosynthesis protein [Flavobacteriaceae bacterium TP-CH-4]|uniref:PhzF family phenazine biosynthesis protein n=1 Tax=Pelagihabitans pacificus TaxID=2696054 RepID=A0A967AU66_9FLAO|nr:PhzF family phenazine biosynthesis protein [Pelagihabitans pacificus]NHF60456.1 PhzF family phenazine biosynthesis protein [Pelagihabitans pacificus]
MQRNIQYFILDVFAEEKYTGNQLAVFLDLEQRLSDAGMLTITREINFAESAFIRSREADGTFGVRIFTPEYEVPFAGHPSLGSAYVIAKHLETYPRNRLILRLKKGDIPIDIQNPERLDESRFTMHQASPKFGPVFSAETIGEVINLPLSALDDTMPFEVISTGLPYLIVFLSGIKAMKELHLNDERVIEFLKANGLHKSNSFSGLTTSFFFVSTETSATHIDYRVRMFAVENEKLWEDAATGSANGCLLAYLLKHSKKSQSVVVEQGIEMGRRSIIYLDGELKHKTYSLRVGGQVAPISSGSWGHEGF